MPPTSSPLFGPDFLKTLEYLSLVSRRVFRGQLLAQRRTRQLGGGVEFADHREYTPGDDFRYLDWNLYARHDELLLRRFQEEEDLHVYFLVDCSRSMAGGSPPKFDYARRVAAAMAYIALADLDRVAISTFAGDLVASLPLTRGKDRILGIMQFLERAGADPGPTDLRRVANSLVRRSRGLRRGLVVVVSDLFDPEGYQAGLDVLRHHRYEPHVVQVYDRLDADPALKGDVELLDVETGAVEKVTVTERSIRRYKEVFGAFLESVRAYGSSRGISVNRTTTDVPFDELILKMMRASGALG